MEEKKLTSYASIDKPWLKYYSEEAINASMPECTIFDYLWENNKEHLDDIALRYFNRKISFGEMFKNIEKAARAFLAIGVKQGDIVVMATVTTPETIYAVYALNRLGAVANMIDPRTSVEGIKEYITEVEAEFALCIDVAYPKIEKAVDGTTVKKIIVTSPADSLSQPKKFLFNIINKLKGDVPKLGSNCLTWSDMLSMSRSTVCAIVAYQTNMCCVIEHTGGTTGLPKGVMLTNDNFNSAAEQIKNSPLRLERQDRFLNIMPPFIAYGMVLGIHIALTHGWESIIIPKFDPKDFANLILKYQPAGIMGVPTYFEGLMDEPKIKGKNLSCVKVVLVGGDKVLVEFEKKVNAFFEEHNANIHLSKGYSMTEASATATFAFEEINKPGSAGIPFAQTIVAAFEPETDKELPIGKSGEMCICTPTMMAGYYGKQEETDKIIKKHSDGRMWIHSGDLGYVDEDGCIYINGRLKRMIIRFDGFKVFPPFIEDIVSTHEAVETCCAVGIPDKEHVQGYLPIVFVVLKAGCNADVVRKELFALCQRELPEYMQPVDFVFIDKMPLTPIGKVDYRALEKVAEQLL